MDGVLCSLVWWGWNLKYCPEFDSKGKFGSIHCSDETNDVFHLFLLSFAKHVDFRRKSSLMFKKNCISLLYNVKTAYVNSQVCFSLTVPPRVLVPAPVVRSLPGYEVTCSATGSPPIYLALMRDNTVLVNTTTPARVRLYMEGNYTCVATSRYGTNTSNFVLSFVGRCLV